MLLFLPLPLPLPLFLGVGVGVGVGSGVIRVGRGGCAGGEGHDAEGEV